MSLVQKVWRLNRYDSVSWKCPYCGNNATIQNYNVTTGRTLLSKRSIKGRNAIDTTAIICPNEECEKIHLIISLQQAIGDESYFENNSIQTIKEWILLPSSCAKTFPEYIPLQLRQDYEEACAILNLSPKSSATLSRRCLQGIIRDFWGVQDKRNLFQEIEAIREKADPQVWDILHDIRNIGNIGAHMEQDVNLIIDIDPGEAQILIELIETLFEETYIARDQREQRFKRVKEICKQKKEQKLSQYVPEPEENF